MTIADNTRDEKLQYSINREVAKISALSSGEIDKYEFLTIEEMFPSEQSRIIEQVKFAYSPLDKALEKLKTIEDQGIRQVEALKALKTEGNQELESVEGVFLNKIRTNEIKNEIDEIKK